MTAKLWDVLFFIFMDSACWWDLDRSAKKSVSLAGNDSYCANLLIFLVNKLKQTFSWYI